jgi:hypothetical protein
MSMYAQDIMQLLHATGQTDTKQGTLAVHSSKGIQV